MTVDSTKVAAFFRELQSNVRRCRQAVAARIGAVEVVHRADHESGADEAGTPTLAASGAAAPALGQRLAQIVTRGVEGWL
jgi:hypothetical protein